MSLDPFKPKTCIAQAIHSIGAGASLLSATDVGKESVPFFLSLASLGRRTDLLLAVGGYSGGNRLKCASSLTWASSHYFRHLFGLSPSSPKKRAINVIWLSRAKMFVSLFPASPRLESFSRC